MSCPAPEYTAIMAVLRAERIRQGLSQHAVGFRLGRSSQAVSMWESGARIVPGDDLFAWAATLGVPLGIPQAVTV